MHRLRVFCIAALAMVVLMAAPGPISIRAQSGSAIAPNGTRAIEVGEGSSGVVVPKSGSAKTSAPAAIVNVPARTLAVSAYDPDQAARIEADGLQDAALYITSTDEPNRLLHLAAKSLVPVAGTGTPGSLGDGGAATSAELSLKLDSLTERSGVAVAADGSIFIADSLNSTVRRVAGPATSEPGVIRSVAGKWAPAQNVSLAEPLGLAVDRAGNLYIADRAAGSVLELHSATAETPGTLEVLTHVAAPANIAVTADGSKLYVSSSQTGAVFVFTPANRSIAPVFPPAPSPDFTSKSSDHSTVATAPCAAMSVTPDAKHHVCPAGLAVNQSGDLFVSNGAENNVLRFDAMTSKVSIVGLNFASPGALALDAKGTLYASDQLRNQVVRFANQGGPAVCTNTSPSGTITLCPATYDFGLQPTGGKTPVFVFTATNNSSSDVTMFAYAIGGTNATDFSVQSSSCLATFSANSSCVINVIFAPSATGERDGELSLSDLTPGDAIASSVSGTGDDYQILLGSNQTQSVTITAGYTAAYNLVIQPLQGFSGPVTVVCPANLPSFSYCAITSPSLDKTIPNTVDVTAGLDAPFTVTITTTNNQGVTGLKGPGPAQAAFFTGSRRPGGFPPASGDSNEHLIRFLPLALSLLIALLLVAGFQFRIGGSARRTFTALTLLALASALLAGCHHATAKSTGTPTGTTNLLIQGTAQNAARGFTVQLVVQ
ncbi:MAG: choice-of-anchor D domain-containing protein [Candidatus Acidiferrales bacterium]